METEIAGQYRFDILEGTIWVTVRPAETKTYSGQDGPWSATYARIVVSTTEPANRWREQGDPRGMVKLRGRAYSIDVAASMVPETQRYTIDWGPEKGKVVTWTHDTQGDPYRDGFRNADDAPVSDGAKARDQLWDIVEKVGDLLDSEHPQWRVESARKELEVQINSHQYAVTRALETVEKERTAIRALEVRIEALTA